MDYISWEVFWIILSCASTAAFITTLILGSVFMRIMSPPQVHKECCPHCDNEVEIAGGGQMVPNQSKQKAKTPIGFTPKAKEVKDGNN